jgi:hypothetical protein
VTKVDDNMVYEIGGKPALELYQHYFENFAPDAAYPMAVFPPDEDRFFLRGVLSHDPDCGSLKISGDMPSGAEVQIAEATQEDILTAANTAFAEAWENYPGAAPAAALFFSCAWRRWILGTQTAQEFQSIAQELPAPLPMCGFYTYGEITPLREHGQVFLHNTTFVTLLIGQS